MLVLFSNEPKGMANHTDKTNIGISYNRSGSKIMKLKTYKDWSIFAKIMSLSVLTWLVLVLATVFALAPFVRGLITKEKQASVSYLVQGAASTLASYQKQVDAGKLTMEEARKQAAERIAGIRYDGTNYLWLNDINSKRAMHPH